MRLACFSLVLLVASMAHAEGEDVAAAREHYRRGNKAYDLGRYHEAAQEYEQAYEAKDDPALLFNVAQAYRLAEDYKNALRAYRAFLRRMPRAPNREEVEARIADLQKLIDQQTRTKEAPPEGPMAPQPNLQKAPAPAPTPTPTPKNEVVKAEAPKPAQPQRETPPLYKRWWLWAAVGGVVVVGVALGVGLGVGLRDNGFATTLRDVGPGTTGGLTVRY